MKKLITISLLLVLSLSLVLHNAGVLISYQIHKEYISKTLCENIAKPALHCNGKCYLKKQLKKADSETQHPLTPHFHFKYLTLAFISPSPMPPFEGCLQEDKKELLPFYLSVQPQDYVHKMLRPPAFV